KTGQLAVELDLERVLRSVQAAVSDFNRDQDGVGSRGPGHLRREAERPQRSPVLSRGGRSEQPDQAAAAQKSQKRPGFVPHGIGHGSRSFPKRACNTLNATSGQVSARNSARPKDKPEMPAASMRSSSASLQPPSGPCSRSTSRGAGKDSRV